MPNVKKSKEIIDGAVAILSNRGSFCRGAWFVDGNKATSSLSRKDEDNQIEPTDRAGFKQLQAHLWETEASFENPTFRVCGQGAIFVSAILLGYGYAEAQDAIGEVEDNVDEHIPDFNDDPSTSRLDVRRLLQRGTPQGSKVTPSASV